jgi:hypothetical protein
MAVANTLAYNMATITAVKCFIVLVPDVIFTTLHFLCNLLIGLVS